MKKITRKVAEMEQIMNEQAQRIAIAEACGCYRVKNEAYIFRLPDYLHDLNAMHEAVASLNNDMQCLFVDELQQIVRRQENIKCGDKPEKKWPLNHFGLFEFANATVAQRAEAFLRTIRKWEDEP
jgi:hypothetical protein